MNCSDNFLTKSIKQTAEYIQKEYLLIWLTTEKIYEWILDWSWSNLLLKSI